MYKMLSEENPENSFDLNDAIVAQTKTLVAREMQKIASWRSREAASAANLVALKNNFKSPFFSNFQRYHPMKYTTGSKYQFKSTIFI